MNERADPRHRRAALWVVLVALLACTRDGLPSGSDGVQTGFNVIKHAVADRVDAPPVVGARLGGGDPIAEDLIAGKVAVVNFWGSWCAPCRDEQPKLEALWRRYRDDGVAFVGVNTRRDQEAAALAFVDEFDVTYPSVFDPTQAIAADYGLHLFPVTIVIDARGKIAAEILGALRAEEDLASILDAEIR